MPKKRVEIIFPNRPATMRDVALFSHWAGIEVHLQLSPIPKKEKRARKKAPGRKARKV